MHIEFFRVTFVYVITLSFIFCVYISYIDSRHVVSHHFCTSLPFLIYMLLTQDMNFTTILYIHVYNNVTNISAPRVLHFSAIHYSFTGYNYIHGYTHYRHYFEEFHAAFIIRCLRSTSFTM